jgi:hypothetical protein
MPDKVEGPGIGQNPLGGDSMGSSNLGSALGAIGGVGRGFGPQQNVRAM